MLGDGARPELDLARIFREHLHEIEPLRPHEAEIVHRIMACRTAELGGHLYVCPACSHSMPVYAPCQDRHCPKCHRQKQAQWVEQRARDLLPIPYFHVVFTLPDALHPLFLANRALAYSLLFAAAAETLGEVSRRRLQAQIGFLAVLHTWTQTLLYHPHIHCVVTGGGLSLDGQRWVACRPNFFLAVRVLAEVFRGKLLHKLERALEQGQLQFDPDQARRCLREAAHKRWVVYSKPPFAGPEGFLKYISRYVHRVAIDDRRIVGYDGQRVTFQYRDRRQGDVVRQMTLTASAFLRRFLLHLLPKGFTKIRSYGLLANNCKTKNLELCRQLIGPPPPPPLSATLPEGTDAPDPKPEGHLCPNCATRLVRSQQLPRMPRAASQTSPARPP